MRACHATWSENDSRVDCTKVAISNRGKPRERERDLYIYMYMN